MKELNCRGLAEQTYLWSDDNLSTDYFWRFLSAELESHSTEIEVITALRSSAEFIADNSGTLESAADGIQRWISAYATT